MNLFTYLDKYLTSGEQRWGECIKNEFEVDAQ